MVEKNVPKMVQRIVQDSDSENFIYTSKDFNKFNLSANAGRRRKSPAVIMWHVFPRDSPTSFVRLTVFSAMTLILANSVKYSNLGHKKHNFRPELWIHFSLNRVFAADKVKTYSVEICNVIILDL